MDIQKILDEHFKYHQLIIDNYAKRSISIEYLDKAINACLKQIELSSVSKQAFLKDRDFGFLPVHMGFKQLSIIHEKAGDYQNAIKVSQQAFDEGWGGDWEKRIKRYQEKLKSSKC